MMKLQHLALTAALMFPATNALAADSSGLFAIKGVGLSKCSAFVEIAKSKDAAKLSLYVGWIAGFITASNSHVGQTFDLTPWQNIRTLTLALANHCDRNADSRFGEAVLRLTASLAEDRVVEKSELVTIDRDGKKHFLYAETLRRAQAKLAELGLYTGDLDGQFNDATKLGLEKFQADRKIDVSGLPDQKTLFELLRKTSKP